MKKNSYTYFLATLSGFSQNVIISREVMGSYGGSHSNSEISIMDNVGEVMVTTESNSNVKITQSFEWLLATLKYHIMHLENSLTKQPMLLYPIVQTNTVMYGLLILLLRAK